MFVRISPEQAAPIHHHAHDNRQVHIDSRQVHINKPTLTPELIQQFQHLREADRQFTIHALSTAANEAIQGIEAEAQLSVNTITNNMRLAEEHAHNFFRQHDAALREEASNTVHIALVINIHWRHFVDICEACSTEKHRRCRWHQRRLDAQRVLLKLCS